MSTMVRTVEKAKNYLLSYKKTINPPYSKKDIPVIAATLVFFVLAAGVIMILPNKFKDEATVQTRAAEPVIASLAFNPQGFAATLSTKEVNLSVLAYDQNGSPIYSGVTYEWGISSTGGIGSVVGRGSIASFYPKAFGVGDIFVTARTTSQNLTSSIHVYVNTTGIIPTPTPTTIPTATPTPSPTGIPVDNTSPIVTVTNPLPGSTLKSRQNITLTANASDNVGVSRVEFYGDKALLCSDTTSPYSCSWQVPNPKSKIINITAKAYDAAGNTSQSTISVRVK